MNTPIYPTTLKVIENLRNANGKYSEKNQFLVDIANKCVGLKGFGCNFILNRSYGKNSVHILKNGENGEGHNSSKILKDTEIANFLYNLSITFSDRAFILTENKNGQLTIFCINREYLANDILISCKGSTAEKAVKLRDAVTGETYESTVTTAKGKREINSDDIANVTSAFNSMLGKGYNKALAIEVKKEASA